jgi:selT/selW/selH-like putative selenoprotein
LIKQEFPDAVVELIESVGGVFEVIADGRLIFSKKQSGRHADWEDIGPYLVTG